MDNTDKKLAIDIGSHAAEEAFQKLAQVTELIPAVGVRAAAIAIAIAILKGRIEAYAEDADMPESLKPVFTAAYVAARAEYGKHAREHMERHKAN
jgi:hypothetical protein